MAAVCHAVISFTSEALASLAVAMILSCATTMFVILNYGFNVVRHVQVVFGAS